MSEHLLQDGLRASPGNAEIRSVARTRTLSTLQRLDGARKGQLIQFLQESGLITSTIPELYITGSDQEPPASGDTKQEPDLRTSTDTAPTPIISLARANLDQVDLSSIVQSVWDLPNGGLGGAHLREAVLTGTQVAYLNFTAADLTSANLRSADLRYAHLNNARLEYTDLSRASLRGAQFQNAYLRVARFVKADLTEARFYGAYLFNADLRNATLHDAELRGAVLMIANLSYVDLRNAQLQGADLQGANLRGANMHHVDLQAANLEGATVTRKQLTRCKTLRGATLPNGTKVPDDQDFPPGWK